MLSFQLVNVELGQGIQVDLARFVTSGASGVIPTGWAQAITVYRFLGVQEFSLLQGVVRAIKATLLSWWRITDQRSLGPLASLARPEVAFLTLPFNCFETLFEPFVVQFSFDFQVVVVWSHFLFGVAVVDWGLLACRFGLRGTGCRWHWGTHDLATSFILVVKRW